MSRDGETVGHITDMWLDEGEQMVRYLEYTLEDGFGKGTRLVPIQMVRSLTADAFAGVPTIASADQITMLEEEKVCGYYAGGTLYC